MRTLDFLSARPDSSARLAAEAEGVLKISVRPGHGWSCRRDVQRVCTQVLRVRVACALLSPCWLVCHLPRASALLPNDGAMQQANYPQSGASPQASATSLHQGPPSSRFALGPFQRHTHTQSQWQIIHILACQKVCHSTSLRSPIVTGWHSFSTVTFLGRLVFEVTSHERETERERKRTRERKKTSRGCVVFHLSELSRWRNFSFRISIMALRLFPGMPSHGLQPPVGVFWSIQFSMLRISEHCWNKLCIIGLFWRPNWNCNVWFPCFCFVLFFYFNLSDFKPQLDPVNILQNSPNFVHMSRQVGKKFFSKKCFFKNVLYIVP